MGQGLSSWRQALWHTSLTDPRESSSTKSTIRFPGPAAPGPTPCSQGPKGNGRDGTFPLQLDAPTVCWSPPIRIHLLEPAVGRPLREPPSEGRPTRSLPRVGPVSCQSRRQRRHGPGQAESSRSDRAHRSRRCGGTTTRNRHAIKDEPSGEETSGWLRARASCDRPVHGGDL